MRIAQPSPRLNYLDEISAQQVSQSLRNKLSRAKQASDSFNKSGISLGISEGLALARVIEAAGCKSFVEIGTLTGYSAIWILHGLGTQGKLWTLEKDEAHASAATQVLSEEIASGQVELLLGDARIKLQELNQQYDGVFIDGNKAAYLDYLNWAETHIKPGGLIVADNVFLSGSVWGEQDTPFSEKQVRVMKEFNARLMDPNRYKSYFFTSDEGMLISVKNF